MDKGEQWSGSFSTPFSNYDHHLSTLLLANPDCTSQTKQQGLVDLEDLMETLMKLPTIGLKLQISPSLLKQMQGSTQSKRKRIKHSTQPRSAHNIDGERFYKASILGALMLQIGSFQVVARNEGELVGKFYFAKRQLVWEILKNGLKQKIEIEWSNIIGIQAFMEQNKPGILELELHHPPKFYKEIEPEPRKHTQWTDGSDFTGGQASINRRHCIVFPPRVLDKHYQKLLDKDKHLFELSQKPFPTFNFNYFPSPTVLDQISCIQFEEMKRLNQVNTMRAYEAEIEAISPNYYNSNLYMTTNTNPMASLVWLPQNCEAAPNFSHQSTSPSFDHIESFNETVKSNIIAPHVSSGQFFNYSTYSNVL